MDYGYNTYGAGANTATGTAGDTSAPTNGGGFLSSIGSAFGTALNTTLQYGLPQWLDYDYAKPQGGGIWTNSRPQDLTGFDPEFIRNVRAGNTAMQGGNTGLYIAAGIALLGVVVLMKG